MKKIKLFGIIIPLMSMVIFFSCQDDSDAPKPEKLFEYISLSNNVDFNNLSETDFETIAQAVSRIKISKNDDGLFVLLTKSAQSVNISENLFEYFTYCVERSNQEISSISLSRANLLNSGESENDYYRQKDCVVWSIVGATGKSYEEVNNWVTSNYGYDGISLNDIENVLSHYCSNLTSFSKYNLPTGNLGSGYVIIYGSHMVNAIYNDGGYIFYKDYQNNTNGYISLNDVYCIYKL